jgi:Berberine and berberine like
VEARVVLASGTTVLANAKEHSDLFWALRGAGQATLGVVTQYKYRLHRAYRNVVVATAFELPPHDLIPLLVAAAGQRTKSSSYPLDCHMEVVSNPKGAELDVACPGATERDVDNVQHQVKEYLRHTAPHKIASKLVYNRTSWIGRAQAETDSFEGIMVQYWNGMLMPPNNNAQTWEVLIDALFGLSRNNPHILVDIELRGGAIAEVEASATAFPWRNAAYVVGIGVMVSPTERHADATFQKEVGRVNHVWDLDVAPHLEGMFVNYAMESIRDASAQEVADLAWGDNAARLEQIKALYDPTNAFHSALPIVPAPAASSVDEAHEAEGSASTPSSTAGPSSFPAAASLPPTAQPTNEVPPTDMPSKEPSPNSAVAPPVGSSETFFPTYAMIAGGGDSGGESSSFPPTMSAPAAAMDSSSSTPEPSFLILPTQTTDASARTTSPSPTTSVGTTTASPAPDSSGSS